MNRETLRKVMGAIMREHGHGDTMDPEKLLSIAQDPAHPLHGQFEWSDTRAAHLYRIEQARDLIHRVRVEITTEERVIRVPFFVRDVRLDERTSGYRSVLAVRDERDVAQETLTRELVQLAALRER